MLLDLETPVTTAHRAKLAYIYVRQSTAGQVRQHQESTELQYRLVDRPKERIEVIDDDLGKSGRSSDGRGGFQRPSLAASVSNASTSGVSLLRSSGRSSVTCPSSNRSPCLRGALPITGSRTRGPIPPAGRHERIEQRTQFCQSLDQQPRVHNQRRSRLSRFCHPRRQQHQCPIELPDDKVLTASMALQTEHCDGFATAGVKRIADLDFKTRTPGSMSLFQPASARRIWRLR